MSGTVNLTDYTLDSDTTCSLCCCEGNWHLRKKKIKQNYVIIITFMVLLDYKYFNIYILMFE